MHAHPDLLAAPPSARDAHLDLLTAPPSALHAHPDLLAAPPSAWHAHPDLLAAPPSAWHAHSDLLAAPPLALPAHCDLLAALAARRPDLDDPTSTPAFGIDDNGASMASIPPRAPRCAVAMVSCAMTVGCSEDAMRPHPAPVVWEGEHLEFATNGEVTECGGSLSYLDAFVGAVLDDTGLEAEGTLRYYLLTTEELQSLGGAPSGTRHANDGYVYTNVPLDTHELLHAVRQTAVGFPLPGITFFEEGLAVMYQLDFQTLDADRDVMAALRSISDLRDYMPFEHYGVAGHFTRFLAQEHGIEAVVAFVDDQGDVRTLDALDALFAEHFGEGLDTAIERYRSEYPPCTHFARTRHAVECALPPVAPVDRVINISYELACDDPDVLGPVDGRMWRSFTFDVTRADSYSLSNAIMPFDFTMELVDCDRSCLGAEEETSEGIFFRTPELDPGRYLVRLSRPVDGPGQVGVGISLFD